MAEMAGPISGSTQRSYDPDAMNVHFSIRDAHPVGYDYVPILCALFGKVSVWKPSFVAQAQACLDGHTGLTPADFFQLFEEGFLEFACEDGWDDAALRKSLAAKQSADGGDGHLLEWHPEYDERAKSLGSRIVLRHGDQKDDWDWCDRQVAAGKRSDAFVAASRWLRPPDDPAYKRLPAATESRVKLAIQREQSRAKRDLSERRKKEIGVSQVLRDAAMMQRVMSATETHAPMHRDMDETSLFGSVRHWLPYKRPEGPPENEQEQLIELFRLLRRYSRGQTVEQVRSLREDKAVRDIINRLRYNHIAYIEADLQRAFEEFKKAQNPWKIARAGFVGGKYKNFSLALTLLGGCLLHQSEFAHLTIDDICAYAAALATGVSLSTVNKPWILNILSNASNIADQHEAPELLRVLALLNAGKFTFSVSEIKRLGALRE